MTVFTSARCFLGYAYQAIQPSVSVPIGQARGRDPKWPRLNATLLRLECYLQITRQTLDANDLASAAGREKLAGFTAALFSPVFDDSIRGPWAIARTLELVLSDIFPDVEPFPRFPSAPNVDSWSLEFVARIKAFEARELDQERVAFWRGWVVRNVAGSEQNLRLWALHERFGKETSDQYFCACAEWFRKGRGTHIPVAQEFADYLSRYDRIVDFQDSISVGRVLGDFFGAYFSATYGAGNALPYSIRSWALFVSILEEHLLGKSWATPLPALPRPRIQKIPGSHCNVRKTSDGFSTKYALITPIPLQVTDSQAKELLFGEIKQEFDSLLRWARAEVAEARHRADRRKQLAAQGMVSISGASNTNTGLRHRLSHKCPQRLAHAAATFEANGLNHLRKSEARLIYPTPLDETAYELGLPQPQLLLAHAAVLVANHPSITPSFLERLELFDKNGQRTGLTKTDAGWYLRGNKMRKGAALAQQDILLNAESLRVVEDVVEMTQRLRDWLRANGRDTWRRLFLSTPSMGSEPIAWRPVQESNRQTEWLSARFRTLGGIEADNAMSLARRFTLRRLRASAGVLVYLETGSVEQMAKALGHTEYSASLLDHYLPRPIQEFFVERWVRLFQSGIICEALKNSPFLLEASSFATMAELDEFLENHAFRRIPAHLEDPENVGGSLQEPAQSSVVFGIETGTLTILISLERAVRTAKRVPCGRAIRWARISECLIPFLEMQTEQPEFVAMVQRAREHADASKVEALVYG